MHEIFKNDVAEYFWHGILPSMHRHYLRAYQSETFNDDYVVVQVLVRVYDQYRCARNWISTYFIS